MVSDSEPGIVDNARRTSSGLMLSMAASAHSSGDASSGWSRRDVPFVGDSDGHFLPIFERYGLKRAQHATFIDSLDRLLHNHSVPVFPGLCLTALAIAQEEAEIEIGLTGLDLPDRGERWERA
jgi:hypothetical protein